MFAFGLAHRVLAARLAAPTTTTSIAPDLLARLPLRIDDWMGEDVPLDEAVVRRTDTDAHINRRYSRGGLESVSLYIGCGVRARDMMVHRPEVCYVGAGWTRTRRHPQELSLSNGTALPCTLFEFSRGSLNAAKIAVLYYYIVDGECCRDLSDWQYRFWRIGYVAQVHIVAPSENLAVDEGMRVVSDFAVDSVSQIIELLNRIESDQGMSSPPRSDGQK
jgi:hypothetical protein